MAVVNNSRTRVVTLGKNGHAENEPISQVLTPDMLRALEKRGLPKWRLLGRAQSDRRRVLVSDGVVPQDVTVEVAREVLS